MRCRRCQFENRAGVRFCEECGAQIEQSCPACGAVVPSDRKFCGACGQVLAAPARGQPQRPASPLAYTPRHLAERILAEQAALEARGAPDGERKTITALFADIKGSMAARRPRP